MMLDVELVVVVVEVLDETALVAIVVQL